MGVMNWREDGLEHQANSEHSEMTIKCLKGRKYKKYLPRNDVLLKTGDSKLFPPEVSQSSASLGPGQGKARAKQSRRRNVRGGAITGIGF